MKARLLTRKSAALGFSATTILMLGSTAWATNYSITTLGSPYGNPYGYNLSDMNNSGQIVGSMNAPDGSSHAFLYKDGAIKDIHNNLGGPTSATDINENGEIAISSYTSSPPRSFVYNGSTYVTASLDKTIGARNEQGLSVLNPSYHDHPTLSKKGIETPLTGMRDAFDINNYGQVVGDAVIDNVLHPILYSNGSIVDLGIEDARGGYALKINDRGQIVGNLTYQQCSRYGCAVPYPERGFIYSNGQMQLLGTLAGRNVSVLDMNALGDVVGNSDDRHAFIYHDGVMTDLYSQLTETDGWTQLFNATLINDKGQIAGTGYKNGSIQTYLLTPTEVPVPAAAWLFGSGLLGLASVKRRQKFS